MSVSEMKQTVNDETITSVSTDFQRMLTWHLATHIVECCANALTLYKRRAFITTGHTDTHHCVTESTVALFWFFAPRI